MTYCYRVLTLLVLVLVLLVAGAKAPSASHALTSSQVFGIGDQDDFDIYDSAEFKQIKVGASRYIIHWNAARTPGWARDQADRWYAAASANPRTRLLISFSGLAVKKAPSVGQYRTAVRAAMKRWPKVREYQAWNEMNHSSQPVTYRHPERAGKYAKALKSLCRGSCRPVPITFVVTGSAKSQDRWIKRFVRGYGRQPEIWGLHTYGDANRMNDKGLRSFLRRHRKGQVWLTENAAWATFAAPLWKWDLSRQAKATKHVFKQALTHRKRITRLYWYEWRGLGRAMRWDSGLFNADGSARPAWAVAKKERFRRP